LENLERGIRVDNAPKDHPFWGIVWNEREWSRFFGELSTRLSAGERVDTHPARVAVMIHTVGCCRRGSYQMPKPNDDGMHSKIQEIQINHSLIKTCQYKNPSRVLSDFRSKPVLMCKRTNVSVCCKDSIDVGRELQERGLNPLVLNMASARHPGGGYMGGYGAQEESLFRRSNYYKSLTDVDGGGRDVKYPIPFFGGIHSSGVTVFKSNETEGYGLLDEPFQMSFVAASALSYPQLTQYGTLSDEDACIVRHKIETIFRIGLSHGHDSLVLSAFGCGAFRNPPEQVAEIFKSVIQEFNGFFKEVSFAIIIDHNAMAMAKEGNFGVFNRMMSDIELEFEGSIIPIEPNSRPCKYGGLCRTIDDATHRKDFHHPSECKHGAECEEMSSRTHTLMFSHPSLRKDHSAPVAKKTRGFE
jgi:uncharacterized protein (TIGR02452 family)